MFLEASRDLEISWLSKMPEEKASILFDKLKAAYPEYPELYAAQIKALIERVSFIL